MKRITALLAALAVATTVHAGDPRCSTPPYGSDGPAYSRALHTVQQSLRAAIHDADPVAAAAAETLVTQSAASLVNGAYNAACLAKLDGVDADKWGGANVGSMSIAQLADLVINPRKISDSSSGRVYATFQCVKGSPTCTFFPLSVPQLQSTQEACEESIKRVYGRNPDVQGRVWIATGVWFECRSKPSDEWQR